MKILKKTFVALSTIVLVMAVFPAFADSPETLFKPDSHSVEVKGKVTLYRVQIPAMGLGKGGDKVLAEVFAVVDSKPDLVFSLTLDKDAPPAHLLMAKTLKAAYLNKVPVTLYYQIKTGKGNVHKLLMVQLN